MKVYSEISMRDFCPWSGAKYAYARIEREGKLDDLESIIEELYPEGCSETTINDLLWFDDEYLFDLLGIRTESEIREEIQEVQDEIESLMEDLNDSISGLSPNDASDYIKEYYEDDLKELQMKLEELEDELSEI